MANEQALQDLYKEFVKTGYRGSKEDFKGLMSSNDDAFQDGYKSFTSTGYNGNENDFAELLGVTVPVKKKRKFTREWRWNFGRWSITIRRSSSNF